MASGMLCRVALVRADVSETASSSSSGFLRVVRFHSCVTMESLLISLSTEGPLFMVEAFPRRVFFDKSIGEIGSTLS
jgi:hypothetical protein